MSHHNHNNYGQFGLYGSTIQSVSYLYRAYIAYNETKNENEHEHENENKKKRHINNKYNVPEYIRLIILSLGYGCLALHYQNESWKFSDLFHDIGYFLLCVYFILSVVLPIEESKEYDKLAAIAYIIILTNVKIHNSTYAYAGHAIVAVYYILYIAYHLREMDKLSLVMAAGGSLLAGHYIQKL